MKRRKRLRCVYCASLNVVFYRNEGEAHCNDCNCLWVPRIRRTIGPYQVEFDADIGRSG